MFGTDEGDFSREDQMSSSRYSNGKGRDRSREEKQADARYGYQEDMAKFNRIIDNRRKSLERAS